MRLALSVAALALGLILLGGATLIVHETQWEVTYYPYSGYHLTKDETGRFLYIDRGGGIISVLSVEADGPRFLTNLAYPASVFEWGPIAVSRGWLYTATAGLGEFWAFDVRDSMNPKGYGPAHLNMITYGVAVLGDMVLVAGMHYDIEGRNVGTVVALNMSDPPSAISSNGSVDTAFRIDILNTRVYAIAVDDRALFVAEGDNPSGGFLHVFDARSSPPREYLNYSLGIRFPHVFVSDSIVAVIGSLNDRSHLQLFRRSGTDLETLVLLEKTASDVSFENGRMYVAGAPVSDPDRTTRDLSVYNISDPTSPRLTDYFQIRGYGGGHAVIGDTAYSLGFANLAWVRNVEEPMFIARNMGSAYVALVVGAGAVSVALWYFSRKRSKAAESESVVNSPAEQAR